MDWDDLAPAKKPAQLQDLEIMGVEELHDYIARLQAEIARAQAAIAAKEKFKSGAEALFRKS